MDDVKVPTIHDPDECGFCAIDPEQCHVATPGYGGEHGIEPDEPCENRAWSNGFCGPHQPDPKVYH